MGQESKIQKILKAELKARGFLVKLSDRFTSGIPDYVWISNGHTVFIETKAPGELLRPLQLWFKNQIETFGGTHFAVTSIEDIEAILIHTGHLKPKTN